MKLYTTLNLLRKHEACAPGYASVIKSVGLRFDKDAGIDLLAILDVVGLQDTLWALQATSNDNGAKSVCVKFAEFCAENASIHGGLLASADCAASAARDAARSADADSAALASAAASYAAWSAACADGNDLALHRLIDKLRELLS